MTINININRREFCLSSIGLFGYNVHTVVNAARNRMLDEIFLSVDRELVYSLSQCKHSIYEVDYYRWGPVTYNHTIYRNEHSASFVVTVNNKNIIVCSKWRDGLTIPDCLYIQEKFKQRYPHDNNKNK